MLKKIYLDNAATTAVDPRVLDSMLPWFTKNYGNPASRNHAFGWVAEEAVEIASERVAALINAEPREIIFTSGATESDNLALRGIIPIDLSVKSHIITAATEHKAVLDTCSALEEEGVEITYLPVDQYGLIDPEKLIAEIRENTVLVSIMHVNNETGVIQPIREFGQICKDAGVVFHVDAAQSTGKIPIDVKMLNIDLLSISAHKMYGPKGIGALYVRRKDPRVVLRPMIYGGGHQRGIRSGTLPVQQIVGLGKACELALHESSAELDRISDLRDELFTGLTEALKDVKLNGHPEKNAPGILNLSFNKADSESLIMGMPNLAVSAGSACTSSIIAPSYVLKAMGHSDAHAYSSIRFGLGRFTTREEIIETLETVKKTVNRLRNLS